MEDILQKMQEGTVVLGAPDLAELAQHADEAMKFEVRVFDGDDISKESGMIGSKKNAEDSRRLM